VERVESGNKIYYLNATRTNCFYHVTTTKFFPAIRATTTLQLGSPSNCQPCCHRNGSGKRNFRRLV